MSSTSWTIDEDFTILIKALHHIEALKLYEEPLIVFITGFLDSFLRILTNPFSRERSDEEKF